MPRTVRVTTLRTLLCVALLGTAPAGFNPASAGDKRTGVLAYLQGRYVEAVPRLEHFAYRHHAAAQHHLGLARLHGRGVARDRAVAYAWFAAAAANGHFGASMARRRLHQQLAIGELPRAARLAREYRDRYSRRPAPDAPCFTLTAHGNVTRCR